MFEKITVLPAFRSEQRLPWITCFLAGVSMGIACDPINAWFLAWIALIPLWVWLIHQQPFHWYQLIPAITFAIGYYGVTLFWITGVHPMTWMGVPWLASLVIAIFCWGCLIVWGTVLVMIWSLAMIFIARKLDHPLQRVLLGVTFWCSLETLWSYTPLHWTTLALTQSPHNLPILQLLSLSGTTTVTAIMAAFNGLLAEAILNPRRKSRFSPSFGLTQGAIALLVIFHLVGWWLYLRPIDTPQNQALRVGIIQGNIPNEIKLYPEGWRKAIAGYTQGYINLAQAGADAVLTPETALPFQWPEQVRQRSEFYQAILEQGVPVWLGAFGTKQGRYTNSLYSITGDGETLSRFDKVKLVPLGEYIPLESVLGKLVDRLSPLDSHLAKGDPDQTFMTPFGQAIVGICYESAYGEHFRRQAAKGGELILSASNDAHYSETMPAQHHAQDIMRAIETDRAMVRATNTGYSAIVDPHGNTLWLSQRNEYQTHLGTIYQRDTKTLYVRWGNWLNWTLAGLSVTIIAFTGIRHNRPFY
ncbi:MAG: apolipoprotein N-acyltransferase [Cyanobacteria bacterium SW_9_44_58]|nr:MAG: apolipoprotein N-acyltransferase [Cyanobacteria bacterium SW_9_44_58]